MVAMAATLAGHPLTPIHHHEARSTGGKMKIIIRPPGLEEVLFIALCQNLYIWADMPNENVMVCHVALYSGTSYKRHSE